jgi:PLP dependent protein
MTAKPSPIAENLTRVRERILRACERGRRDAGEVTLVAVSKTLPVEAICAAYDAGLLVFGENRVQEFESKQPKLANLVDITWHLIGHLQRNKARRAVSLFGRVDSVDSVPLAQKLDSAAADAKKQLRVLIEVHVSGEASKSGVACCDLPTLADRVSSMPSLELLGLMAVPPFANDPERARPYFAQVRGLRDNLSDRLQRALPVLSMGMSNDFEVAIEEGATEIRVGTALFGQRR